jgi:hypothetical protein
MNKGEEKKMDNNVARKEKNTQYTKRLFFSFLERRSQSKEETFYPTSREWISFFEGHGKD